eukprot:913419-Alexandrium_andersonii.AAC.1
MDKALCFSSAWLRMQFELGPRCCAIHFSISSISILVLRRKVEPSSQHCALEPGASPCMDPQGIPWTGTCVEL